MSSLRTVCHCAVATKLTKAGSKAAAPLRKEKLLEAWIVIIDDLTHLQETFNPKALKAVSDWIEKRTTLVR